MEDKEGVKWAWYASDLATRLGLPPYSPASHQISAHWYPHNLAVSDLQAHTSITTTNSTQVCGTGPCLSVSGLLVQMTLEAGMGEEDCDGRRG
jgi:hypothetical protein